MQMNNIMRFEMKTDPEKPEIADIYIYDYVGDKRADSETNVSTANAFRKMLDSAKNVKALNLHINSYGGACADGVAIYSLLRQHNAAKTAYVDGYACSIATLIVAACDKVVMSTASAMQIHSALTFTYGNSSAMRAAADSLDKITAGIKAAYLDRSGGKLTAEKLDKLITGKDGDGSWLTATECMQYGLCDEIIGKSVNETEPEPVPTEPKAENKTELMNTFRAFIL